MFFFFNAQATGVSTANTSASEDGNEREKLKRFVALRQDLEKVRNCCYMLSKREKLKKSMVKMREQILEKQLKLFTEEANVSQMSNMELSAILEANHGPGVYDRLFAHSDAEVNNENDFEIILSRLSGEITESSATIRRDRNNKNKENNQAATETQNKPAYKRIFSDSSEPSDDEVCSSININFYVKMNFFLLRKNSSNEKVNFTEKNFFNCLFTLFIFFYSFYQYP